MNSTNFKLLDAGIRNEFLNEILSKEKQKEKELNTQLQQEIEERTNSQNALQKQYQELEQLNGELRNAKDGLETANRNLAHAIGEIKHLSGMLPICVSCKKIRNDSGYWEQIEAYIHNHSEAEFSHSLCPECSRKLYGDLIDETEHA
jgi:serine phosphatase RsbU (regulator of sigma subunit)